MAAPARARPQDDLNPATGPLAAARVAAPLHARRATRSGGSSARARSIWPFLAVPMAGRLLMRRRTVRVPGASAGGCSSSSGSLSSIIGLQGEAPFPFLWRIANYFSATVTFVYIYNAPREQLPARRVVGLLAGFWIVTVAGGWLGVLLPYGELTTIVERLLPGHVAQPRVRPPARSTRSSPRCRTSSATRSAVRPRRSSTRTTGAGSTR